MIQALHNHPWIGVLLCGGIIGYWTWLFIYRHRKSRETPAGEWILYGIGWIALLFFLFLAVRSGK